MKLLYGAKRRYAALLLVLLMVSFFLVSGLLLYKHAGHSCREGACTVCVQLKDYFRKLKELAHDGSSLMILFCLYRVMAVSCISLFTGVPRTPVMLKIRMNR